MPRKRREVWPFSPYGEPVEGCEYLALVLKADREGRVRLRHLDGDQAGRTIDITLPLPIRPEGLTAEFAVSVGLTPQDAEFPRAIGKVVCVVFTRLHLGGLEIVSFAPSGKEESHEPDA